MAIRLGDNRYGKAETRVVRVDRRPGRHEITDVTVSVALSGDFDAVHRTGDNSDVLPTDSQKNTVFAFARQYGIEAIEEFGARLARHFVDSRPAVTQARIGLTEYPWERVAGEHGPTEHSFVRSGDDTRTATIGYDGEVLHVVSGLAGMTVLNTTNSEFWGYVTDEYTTLPETTDRMLATAVTARWRHIPTGASLPGTDFAKSFQEVKRLLLAGFADTYSYSLQQTLYEMGRLVLTERPEIAEIRLAMPNKHHFLVDLSPFDMDNDNEVYYAADRPYGLIEGTVLRDDIPTAERAW